MPAVLMPRLSDSMEEGTIVAWLVPDGTAVAPGVEIVEIETDKATMAYAADAAGVLRIGVGAGTTLPLGTPIGLIEVDGEEDCAEQLAAVVSAAEHLTEAAAAAAPAPAAPAPAAAVPTPEPAADARPAERRDPTRIERLIARRMVQSRTEIPEFTVTVEVDMSAALALRADLKAVAGGHPERRAPSVNDLIVKASALALADHPRINSAWIDGQIVEPRRIDVGVAVATDDGGLVVPVVRDADQLTLGRLAARTRELTRRARDGQITPPELSGGTFTISNLGMLGVAHFTAIISPGQGAILAVGSSQQRYVPVDGQPTLRPIVALTLTCDHRVIYGAHAAAFLDRLRALLEHPGGLAL
ncbi:dihydrolipoamide acetyltransferase family protein [Patulibacter defluvii]|uniref:dihydrolipoamide acetyltransferase family protein n=1 Tax=Patulibacter defluvii TaxID=3095358 RepID=UPI002A760762|nr:dihydrolipoamide acetyltransferase family protein [Patulibacter sp. DM4]